MRRPLWPESHIRLWMIADASLTLCSPLCPVAVHLDHYRSESDFKRLYDEKYKILFSKAARFLSATSASPQSTLILISAGFDACSYEYPGMQRHGKHVPPSFYHTFARDAVAFAESHAHGKLVSVLEGGYSDRALCSAALAHVTGLAGASQDQAAEYWKLENLIAVEKVAKKMAAHAAAAAAAVSTQGGAGSTNTTPKRRQAELQPWLSTTSKAFAAFEQACGKQHVVALGATATPSRGAGRSLASAVSSPAVGVGGRVLRDRGGLKGRAGALESATSTPQARRNASPTKGTPTRSTTVANKESLTKKESPIKAKGGAFGGMTRTTVTPVKVERDEMMAMDTDTPTRTTEVSAEMVTTPVKAQSSGEQGVGQPQRPHPSAAHSSETEASDPTRVIHPHPASPSVASTTTTTTTAAAPPSFATSSLPIEPSPQFTSPALTLVDALSPPAHRTSDANTTHIVSGHDILGLDYLRERSFGFANGNGDEDAPGSPDPFVHESEVPGGVRAVLGGLSLDRATLGRSEDGPGWLGLTRNEERNVSMYPVLPGTSFDSDK